MRIMLSYLALLLLVGTPSEAQPRHGGAVYVQDGEPTAAVVDTGHFWYQPSTGKLFLATATNPPIWSDVGMGTGGGSAAWGSITGTLSSQTDLQTALNAKQAISEKGVTNGYASLGADGKVPSAQLPASGSDPWTYVSVAGDVAHSDNTTLADVTGLAVSVSANTSYEVFCVLHYTSAATTTGALFSWTGPASPTLTGGLVSIPNTTTSMSGTTLTGNDSGTPPAATPVLAPAINTAVLNGNWRNGANAGTLQIRVRPEVNASAITVKAGSFCRSRSY